MNFTKTTLLLAILSVLFVFVRAADKPQDKPQDKKDIKPEGPSEEGPSGDVQGANPEMNATKGKKKDGKCNCPPGKCNCGPGKCDCPPGKCTCPDKNEQKKPGKK